ncbi:Uncharacterised protein [Salmonella enterica subsp. enterica serovar Bovismorbificans]|uniref:Uncharacterized protein n=1 Tax=Salmonella enterica subsp. enterica serovar Bovismorbificans TaxID=58097 RepID=A0A655C1K4_SALET|nr:Uncharacterised protein [Salmonella enterica subsp. enterica serovar Bovismorbificans]CNT91137.1 Uncharacterised protein [Salmonella enterica subsp. enterica serovar Bovismorbificans]CPR62656.1 Uncharacterised protein [Salmonella enterica subsp. enterica serovar Bovismorbificans]
MGVFPHIAGAGNAIFRPLFSNRLGDRQNMRFVETVTTCAAAMAGSAKFHGMFCIPCLRFQYIILRRQLGDVNQITLLRGLSCAVVDCHCLVLLMQGLNCSANLFNQFRRELH